MNIIKMTDLDLKGKRVLIREDFNVPIHDGQITSDARLRAALPTLQYAIEAGAKIIILSHLGRPNEGEFKQEFSLAPVAERLADLLQKPVRFANDWLNGLSLAAGEIVLCENVRFQKGEKRNDPVLAQKMAALCDVFVMVAFATAHRAEASTYGVAEYAPIACAGLLLANELEALHKALADPRRPLVAIVGGAKVSTKITVLEALLRKVDHLIIGGGIANTFLAAAGFPVGVSLFEPESIDAAKYLVEFAKKNNTTIPLPKDVVVAHEFKASVKGTVKSIHAVLPNEMILDIGPETIQEYTQILKNAGTILWNGPVGVFEFPAFATGTKTLAHAIVESSAFTIAGGGDTLAAIEKFGIGGKLSYVSTGGGAFLEFVEGKELPAIKILQERGAQHV